MICLVYLDQDSHSNLYLVSYLNSFLGTYSTQLVVCLFNIYPLKGIITFPNLFITFKSKGKLQSHSTIQRGGIFYSSSVTATTHKAILHYALGLRFGNVCYQNATKTRPKRDQNATKTRPKRDQNATKTRPKRN